MLLGGVRGTSGDAGDTDADDADADADAEADDDADCIDNEGGREDDTSTTSVLVSVSFSPPAPNFETRFDLDLDTVIPENPEDICNRHNDKRYIRVIAHVVRRSQGPPTHSGNKKSNQLSRAQYRKIPLEDNFFLAGILVINLTKNE